jgi:hypothetical protein
MCTVIGMADRNAAVAGACSFTHRGAVTGCHDQAMTTTDVHEGRDGGWTGFLCALGLNVVVWTEPDLS